MNRYQNGQFTLIIHKDAVDLFSGSVCVKTKKTTAKELEIDTAKKIVNQYIRNELFRNYIHICNVVEWTTNKRYVDPNDEGLWLEYLKTRQVKRLRELMERVERDYA